MAEGLEDFVVLEKHVLTEDDSFLEVVLSEDVVIQDRYGAGDPAVNHLKRLLLASIPSDEDNRAAVKTIESAGDHAKGLGQHQRSLVYHHHVELV